MKKEYNFVDKRGKQYLKVKNPFTNRLVSKESPFGRGYLLGHQLCRTAKKKKKKSFRIRAKYFKKK